VHFFTMITIYFNYFNKSIKGQYTYDHEKYNENKVNRSATGIYNSAATAFDSAAASKVAK
jgi:hypothetical protein